MFVVIKYCDYIIVLINLKEQLHYFTAEVKKLHKKVILLVVDSLLPGPLEQAVATGKAPNIAAIANSGVLIKDGVTVLPTMSCSIDTSLVTGVFPHEHKIPGLVWYNSQENRVVNYGSSFGTVWRLGFRRVMEDLLYKLNKEHISGNVVTIYEQLEKRGYTTGNVNLAVYRGKQNHDVKLPFLLNILSGFSFNKQLKGPKLLALGKLINVKLPRPFKLIAPATAFKRYGVNDDYTIEMFEQFVNQDQLPDFFMGYLPDMDQSIHKNGTKHVLQQIEKIDYKIERMLTALGGVDKALEQTIWIITSDHGQIDIGNDQRSQINLDDILKDFAVHNLRNQVNLATTDVIICNNERLAYLYTFRNKSGEIIEALKQDARIDWIAYPDGDQVVVEKRAQLENYTDDYKLIYRRDGEYTDCYNQAWTLMGDMRVLDLHTVGQRIQYGDYPDALMRLYGAVFAQRTKDVIVITAKPSYEFKSQGSAKHNGGASHGSLHRQDSEIPIIIGGTTKTPKHNRIVDIKQFVLQLLP